MDAFMKQLVKFRALTAYQRHLDNLRQRQVDLLELDMLDAECYQRGLLSQRELLARLLPRIAERERVQTAIFYQTCKIEEATYATVNGH